MIADYTRRMTLGQRVRAFFGIEYNPGMPIEPEQERLYSLTEAAEYLGVSRQRVHQFVQDGRLEVRRAGKIILIPESQLATLRERYKPIGRPKSP